MRSRLALLAAVATSLAACSPSSGETVATRSQADSNDTQATHPESGLRVIPLTVQSGDTSHNFRVEVAQSRIEQAQGLMYRAEMADDEGMLFPLAEPREASFWMRNTVIPLDIVFIGPDRRILNIEANAVPYSLDHRRSKGEAAAVLELNGGLAEELGIEPGDEVDW